PVDGVADRFLVRSYLLEGTVSGHEVPELAVGVQVLHVAVHDVGTFQGVTRLEGTLVDATGLQVAHLDPVESLTLARLDVLVLEDRTGITVEHYLKTRLEFVGRIVGHKFPTYSLNGYIRIRADPRSQPAFPVNARRMYIPPMRGTAQGYMDLYRVLSLSSRKACCRGTSPTPNGCAGASSWTLRCGPPHAPESRISRCGWPSPLPSACKKATPATPCCDRCCRWVR